jgi:hypothetical protein
VFKVQKIFIRKATLSIKNHYLCARIQKSFPMLRFVLFVCILAGAVSSSIFSQPEEKKEVPQVKVTDRCLQLYREMDLEGRVNYAAFRQAVTGYYRIGGRKRKVLTLIDFSKPSTQERLYVFDMKQRKMLFSCSSNSYRIPFTEQYNCHFFQIVSGHFSFISTFALIWLALFCNATLMAFFNAISIPMASS